MPQEPQHTALVAPGTRDNRHYAGSAASPPTALAVAIAMAMENGAERHCGRLALITLAELANVVRWASLPDQFPITAPRG